MSEFDLWRRHRCWIWTFPRAFWVECVFARAQVDLHVRGCSGHSRIQACPNEPLSAWLTTFGYAHACSDQMESEYAQITCHPGLSRHFLGREDSRNHDFVLPEDKDGVWEEAALDYAGILTSCFMSSETRQLVGK